jgi:hypothetical protein
MVIEPIYGVENMVEIELPNSTEEGKRADFLKIVETLTRMGIVSRTTSGKRKLIQSAHILHKQGRYYIVHFKEMFLLDGREETEFTEEDMIRRNTIASRLAEWNLLKIVDENKVDERTVYVKIIPYKEKDEWELESKYNIGGKRK